MASILDNTDFEKPITREGLKDVGFNFKIYSYDFHKINFEDYSDEEALKFVKRHMFWDYTYENGDNTGYRYSLLRFRYFPKDYLPYGFYKTRYGHEPEAWDVRGKLVIESGEYGNPTIEVVDVNGMKDITDRVEAEISLFERNKDCMLLKRNKHFEDALKDTIDAIWGQY
jgi:hypothetical protein